MAERMQGWNVWKKSGWMSKIMNDIEELEVTEGKDRCILGCFSRKGQEVASPPQTEVSSTNG